jgi:flagellar biosynthetic protein FliP
VSASFLAAASSINVNLGNSLNKPSESLLIILAITLLGVAPSLLILLTGFTRIVIVLSLTRQALGLQTTPPNQVIAGLALILSLFIMTPTLTQMNKVALQPYLNGQITLTKGVAAAEVPLKTWMLKQTGTSELSLTTAAIGSSTAPTTPTGGTSTPTSPPTGGASTPSPVPTVGALTPVTIPAALATPSGGSSTAVTAPSGSGSSSTGTPVVPPSVQNTSMAALIPAFMLSQLKSGFIIGFVIFIPFLIIDLVVASVLMSLGIVMLPPTLVSLPFKLLLFIMVNGWVLVTHSLLVSFR